jgi:hydrogenase maturation factor
VAPRRLQTGKLPPALLAELLARAPALPPEVRLGPALGEDAAAIDVPGGALVAATDPITLTGRGVGAHAVVVNANDVAVMGVRPRWFLACVLLPPGATDADARALFDEILAGVAAVGACLVGGHTEVTPAVTQPLVVGQMLGLAEDGQVIRTGGVRPGDALVQIGPAPVEGAAVLAAEAGARLAGVDPGLLARARGALVDPGISVVEAALTAAALGATALHDPTESGLSGGLHELAGASVVALRVDPGRVLWFEPGLAVCAALGADPWGTLASGCVLAAFPAGLAEGACRTLEARGQPARVVGVAEAGSGVHLPDGQPLPVFERDEVARVLE